ncbi:MAG: GNAT family N-acetyltransferase, partial [Verrucomicrobiales bacterium]|nr:GNAT family N-acetyltransferase [Verrucomicrobiales bacterium]
MQSDVHDATARPDVDTKPRRLEARVHTSVEDLESLRPWWTAHQTHPNTDLDYFLLVCRQTPQLLSPLVISLREGGDLVALLVGRLERLTVKPRIAYLRLPGVTVNRITILHGGLIGALDEAAAAQALGFARSLLQTQRADSVLFNLVSHESTLWRVAQRGTGHAAGFATARPIEHWVMKLEAEPGFLVRHMKSKHRSWYKRKQREVVTEFAEITWTWHAADIDVPALCQEMESVAAQTYQRGLGAGFRDDAVHRARLEKYARGGHLRCITLRLNGQPSGFWYGTVYGDAFHSMATGYLPALAKLEIGTQMFMALVDHLVQEKVTCFDFGLGDAHYKQRF